MGSGKGPVETETTTLGQVTFHIYLTILRWVTFVFVFVFVFATRWESGDGSEKQWELGEGSGLVKINIK